MRKGLIAGLGRWWMWRKSRAEIEEMMDLLKGY